MEDWEQHFVDKSRRRFEKERNERRRGRTRRTLAVVVLAVIFVGAIVGLAAWA